MLVHSQVQPLLLCSTVHSLEELVERRRARRARLLLSLQRAAQVSCEASDPCVSVGPVSREETRAVLGGRDVSSTHM